MLWGLRQVEAPAPADLRGMGELGCRPLKWRLLYKVHLPPVFFINVSTYSPAKVLNRLQFSGCLKYQTQFWLWKIALMLKYFVQKRAEAVQCFVWNYLIGIMSTPLLRDPQSQLEQETEFQRKRVPTFESGRVSSIFEGGRVLRWERVFRERRILHLREGMSVLRRKALCVGKCPFVDLISVERHQNRTWSEKRDAHWSPKKV